MWKEPSAPPDEAERLKLLDSCEIMDTPREERFDRLTRLAARMYHADAAFIGFIDESAQWMKSMTGDLLAPVVPRRLTVCNMMVESGEPLLIDDLKTDPRLDGHPIVPQLTLRFYAGVPLRVASGPVIGSFCVMRLEAGGGPDFDMAPLLDFAAITMDELELRMRNLELTRLSRLDALTGIANRRAFDEAMDRAIRRARRTDLPLSLLLVDVDHFKALNDAHGHPAGDAALRQIAAILSGAVSRPYDVVARYGGEEFAVILPDTDAAGAAHIGENLRQAIALGGLTHPSQPHVSISIGCTTGCGAGIEAAPLIANADAALYRAKRAGRDRLMIHEQA